MQAYKRRTGTKMTYALLAERTGLSPQTFAQIATATNHGATLATIEKICWALDTTPAELLELFPDTPRKAKKKKTSRKKKTKKR